MSDQQIIEALAEKLMGWHMVDVHPPRGPVGWYDEAEILKGWHDEFNPLTDPAACAQVLDEIERRGWAWTWDCWRSRKKPYGFGISSERDTKPVYTYSETRYRAVCLVALRAVGVEV